MPKQYKKTDHSSINFFVSKTCIIRFRFGVGEISYVINYHLSQNFVAAMLNRLNLNLTRISVSDLRSLYVIKLHRFFFYYK